MLSPAQVFISVKTEDNDVASTLNDALTKLGYDVWWQKSDLKSGQDWHGEINKAVPAAGAVVVLWSKKSMASPWVQHEASQGIAKGTYTPVRIEPIEIPRPYDRVQAIDLMNWDGEADHAGFQNLLARLQGQMPPPVPRWQQATTLFWQHRALILLAAIALSALYLLVNQGHLLSKQSGALNSQSNTMKNQVGILKKQVAKQDSLFSIAQLQKKNIELQGQTLQDQLRQQAAIIANGRAQSADLKEQLRQQSRTTANVKQQSLILQNQIVQQEKILADVRRALQPIQNLNITASVEVGSATPGFSNYLAFLRDSIYAQNRTANTMPYGVLEDKDEPGVLTIEEKSGLWPRKQRDNFLYYVVRYVDLSLKFNKTSKPGEKPDLLMYVSSYDRDRSERGAENYASTLKWNMKDGALRIDFTDVPATRQWESNNSNIVSVPDLESSFMSASFLSRRTYASNEADVTKSRAYLSLTSLCVAYSGRTACFQGREMVKTTDGQGLSIYNAPVSKKGLK